VPGLKPSTRHTSGDRRCTAGRSTKTDVMRTKLLGATLAIMAGVARCYFWDTAQQLPLACLVEQGVWR